MPERAGEGSPVCVGRLLGGGEERSGAISSCSKRKRSGSHFPAGCDTRSVGGFGFSCSGGMRMRDRNLFCC